MYINWHSNAPIQWKWGTLNNLTQRSVSICSNEKLLEDELNYLRNAFIKVNDYPLKLVNSIMKLEQEKNSCDQRGVTTNVPSKRMPLVLP